jgi:hypothetical protein
MRPLILLTLLTLPALTACGYPDSSLNPDNSLNPDSSLNRCVSGYQRPDFTALRNDLSAAKSRWTKSGISDYTFDFIPSAGPSVHVVVRGGVVQSAQVVGGNAAGTTPPTAGTIETYFQSISADLNRVQAESCPAATAIYDPNDGHPTTFYRGTLPADIQDLVGGIAIQNFTRP